MDTVDPQLRGLLDREAIREVIHRFARGLDRHDEELVASAYHPDALDRHGEFLGRPEEFIPWANALHAADWVAHHHHLTTQTIELDGDIAHAETYCIGTFLRCDEPVVDIAGGRYIDRLERRDGDWRIVARNAVIEWACAADAAASRFSFGVSSEGRWDTTDPSYKRPLTVGA
jgi:ketosteroid isomerase-like protein